MDEYASTPIRSGKPGQRRIRATPLAAESAAPKCLLQFIARFGRIKNSLVPWMEKVCMTDLKSPSLPLAFLVSFLSVTAFSFASASEVDSADCVNIVWTTDTGG